MLHRKYAKHELRKPAETRFAYFFLVLDRLCEERDALERLFASAVYKAWVEKQNAPTKQQHAECRALLHNEAFWDAVELLLKIAVPLVCTLRMVDGNAPCVGKVYHR